MSKLRSLLFWMHLSAGVTAGLVILTMSVTGVLLMYERQLIEWSDRGYRSAPPIADAPRLPIAALLARAAGQRPQQSPTAITLKADPAAPAAIAFGQTTIYQDVYTGRLFGEPTTGVRRVMSELRAWHRWLSLDGDRRPLGKAISGWANIVFLFIVLSGMYLWIPRLITWRSIRQVALPRLRLRGKARDFNWHNAIGIWSAIPLAIVVATATPISFPWANALVYRLVGEAPPAPTAPAARPAAPPSGAPREQASAVDTEGIDALWSRAEQQVPGWQSISLRLPASPTSPAVFAIDRGNGGQPQLRSTLTLNRATAEIVRWEPFESQSAGRRLRSWTRFTHTGEYYGIVGQTIAGLVSGGAVVLVCTGLLLAARRLIAWMAGRRMSERRHAA